MPHFLTSYKSSTGFKVFGRAWQLVYELCVIHSELRFDESRLIRRVFHIGHKLSLPACEDKEGYMMILQDLQKRIEVIGKERNEVEREIDQAFETLVASSSSTVQHKVKQLWSEL